MASLPLEEELNLVRKMIEAAVQFGRDQVDSDTQFLQGAEGKSANVIGIEENFLYALCLLETKVGEQMEMGKALLQRLLYFQSDLEAVFGSFPRFLHEYPQCNDWAVVSRLLPIMGYILQRFASILGKGLKERLQESALKLLAFAETKTFPPLQRLKVQSAKAFLCRYMPELQNAQGEELALKEISQIFNAPATLWCSREAIADTLTALYLVYPSIASSPYHDWWQHVETTYSLKMGSYIGPAFQEWHLYSQAEPHLYDLYMAQLSQKMMPHLLTPGYHLLKSCLISLCSDRLVDRLSDRHLDRHLNRDFPSSFAWQLNGEEESGYWQKREEGAFSLAYQQKKPSTKGYQPFRFVFGQNQPRSLAYQGPSILKEHAFTPNGIELRFIIDQPIERQPELNRALTFYLDSQGSIPFTVNRQVANTFSLGDEIGLNEEELSLKMSFDLIRGEGHFFGHIIRGNRPSQKGVLDSKNLQAFDWLLFLRAVRLSQPCEILLKLAFDAKNEVRS